MALFVLSLCPFDISVGVGAFVIGLGQISSFLSLHRKTFTVFHARLGIIGLKHRFLPAFASYDYIIIEFRTVIRDQDTFNPGSFCDSINV